MTEPHWLNQQIILAIHPQLLARFGGLEGLRDEGLLESALVRPNQLMSDGAPSLFDMAAGEIDANEFSAWLKASCIAT